jgi:hypothetical protein
MTPDSVYPTAAAPAAASFFCSARWLYRMPLPRMQSRSFGFDIGFA